MGGDLLPLNDEKFISVTLDLPSTVGVGPGSQEGRSLPSDSDDEGLSVCLHPSGHKWNLTFEFL